MSFQQGESHLIFTAGGRTLASKMVEAQFPAYEKVVGVTGDKKVAVGREVLPQRHPPREPPLLGAGPRGEAQPRGRAARGERLLARARRGARVAARSSTRARRVEIGFNAQYLLDFLGVVGTDEVALEVKDAESQGLLRPVGEDGGDYRYVVMPMRF